MKKTATTVLAALCPWLLCAQPIVDIGLFPSASPDTLEVRVRPAGDFDGVVSSLTFTIRWPAASPATLGTRILMCPDALPVNPYAGTVSGAYQYRTYNAFGVSLLGDWGCSWQTGQEFVVMRVPVANNTGIGQFHIVNDAYTGSHNSDYFISLGGYEYTGIIYSEPDPGGPGGVLQGQRYLDTDVDCVFDPEDIVIPYQVMELYPGAIPVITGTNGHFDALVPVGEYVIDQGLPTGLHAVCPPDGQLFAIELDSTETVDIANTADDIVDIAAQLITDQPRPGFSYPVHLRVRNAGFSESAPVSLLFTFDAQFSLVSSDPAPDAIVGNTLQWDIDPLSAFESAWIELWIQVPPEPALIGSLVSHTASVTSTPDADPANNSVSVSEMVVGSYDPNDKTAWTSSGTSADEFFIDLDEAITYRIRFQNTGNFPATTVVITDTLDASLDMSTFEQGPASHPFDVRFLPGRVVEWTFMDIQLPDSVTDEPGSHGLVSFRIRPVQPLLAGTPIRNTANIYFDYNEPVITEPSVLTAEFSTAVGEDSSPGQLTVFPNPADRSIEVISGTGAIHGLAIRTLDGRLSRAIDTSTPRVRVDLAGLAPGPYVLTVTTTNGTIHQRRFVKY